MAYKKSTKLLPYQYTSLPGMYSDQLVHQQTVAAHLVVSDSGSVDDLHEWEWGGVAIQSEGLFRLDMSDIARCVRS